MGLFDMLGRGGDYVKNKSKDVANAGVNKGKEIVGYGLIKCQVYCRQFQNHDTAG